MHVPFTDSATPNIDDVTHARLHVVRLGRLRTLLWSTHRVSVACRRASTLEAGTVVNIEGHSMGTSDNSVTALSLSRSLALSLSRSLSPCLLPFVMLNSSCTVRMPCRYAPSYAQIIESPTEMQITPMQIDTWNRDKMNLSTNSPFVSGQ